MERDLNTIEVARLYEDQGYFKDALAVYQTLLETADDTSDIKASIERVADLIARNKRHDGQADGPEATVSEPDKAIAALCEKWLRLIILRHRFHNFLSIRARLN